MSVASPFIELSPNVLMNKRVYAVDDESDSLELIQAIFKNTGAELSAFDSGRKLLEAVKNMPADLYVIDVMMPEMDGWTLMENIRRIDGQLQKPILFTTALFSESEALNLSAQEKFCKIISKPLELRKFRKVVAELLAC